MISLVTLSLATQAGVNLKNGNFYIGFTDIVSNSKGQNLSVTRTYNSKSTEVGWFGFGWGTPYEARVERGPNGSLMLYENGTADQVRFVPRGQGKVDPSADIEKIITAVEKKSKLTQAAKEQLKQKITKNPMLRHKLASRLKISSGHESGLTVYSQLNVNDTITITDKGYLRKYADGLEQHFNQKGLLVQTRNPHNYKVRISYKGERPVKIEDSMGNQLIFTWTGQGFVKSITGRGKQTSSYDYSGRKLVSATNAKSVKFTYEYDSNYNLTKIVDTSIKDPKKNAIIVEYEPKTMFARKVTSRDGSSIRYIYKSNPKNPDQEYSTIVLEQALNGEIIANVYEYEHKQRKDGSLWLYRTRFVTGAKWDDKKNKTIGGLTKETTYHEDSGRPHKVAQGSLETIYEYKDGLLVSRKSNKGDFVKITHTGSGADRRIAKIEDNERTIQYQWNDKNELITAKASTGESILLVYDSRGRITKMVDQNKKSKESNILTFNYNANSRPDKIELEGVGKIQFEYDNAGQVSNIIPDKNPKVSQRVNQAFESFLNIVQPAGVNI